MVVPDHRYCFDHYLGPSDIADVIGAHEERRTVYSVASVIKNRALLTHNRKSRHWLGIHGSPPKDLQRHNAVRDGWEEFKAADGRCIDVHAWQFTPETIAAIFVDLNSLGLTALSPIRIFRTPVFRREFTVVLRKTSA